MGMMIFLPLFLAILAVGAISPFIAVVCGIAAGACAVVVFLPARRMLRGKSSGIRATGILMIIFLGIATLALIVTAVIAGIAALYFYSSLFAI
jgi:hypothetical protein